MASVSFASVWPAATTPSSVAPVSSWTSSTATMSGLARFVTMPCASASNFDAGSDGARFSTLYVATASCRAALVAATTRSGAECCTSPTVVAAIV